MDKILKLDYAATVILRHLYDAAPKKIEHLSSKDLYEDFIVIYDDTSEEDFKGYFVMAIKQLIESNVITIRNDNFNERNNTLDSMSTALGVSIKREGLSVVEESDLERFFNKNKEEYLNEVAKGTIRTILKGIILGA